MYTVFLSVYMPVMQKVFLTVSWCQSSMNTYWPASYLLLNPNLPPCGSAFVSPALGDSILEKSGFLTAQSQNLMMISSSSRCCLSQEGLKQTLDFLGRSTPSFSAKGQSLPKGPKGFHAIRL